MKLWDKGSETDRMVDRFTVGSDREMDRRLAPYDVQGTIAHVTMLGEVGLVPEGEVTQMIDALEDLRNTVARSDFRIPEEFEDIHSYIEYLLTDQLGELGKKVHTARSRNDQVLVDLHLYFRDILQVIRQKTITLADILLELASSTAEVPLPGYTHTQVAMPSSFGMWFSSYAEILADDLLYIETAEKVVDQNPLGSAAGYGTSFPIDRKVTTELLYFDQMKYNSTAAQMSRGRSELAVATALSFAAHTIGRLSADIVLYMSQNFGFISFPDNLTTGSSIMPHKKNPDIFELVRAKCNIIQTLPGQIRSLLGNLTSGYHRDYQLLKEPLFRSIDSTLECLDILCHSLPRMQINREILSADIYMHLYTVDAVNAHVMQGMSFREAYKTVARSVEEEHFIKPPDMEYTHEGSIGNLCLDEIKAKLDSFRHSENG